MARKLVTIEAWLAKMQAEAEKQYGFAMPSGWEGRWRRRVREDLGVDRLTSEQTRRVSEWMTACWTAWTTSASEAARIRDEASAAEIAELRKAAKMFSYRGSVPDGFGGDYDGGES